MLGWPGGQGNAIDWGMHVCPRLSTSPIQYESPGKIIRGKGDSDSNDLFPMALS